MIDLCTEYKYCSHHSGAVRIRDGVANCDVIFCTEASKIIDLISLE